MEEIEIKPIAGTQDDNGDSDPDDNFFPEIIAPEPERLRESYNPDNDND